LDERARPDVALPDHLREVSASHRLRGAAVTCRNVIGVPSAAAEKVTKCGLDAIQLLGGNGYDNDYPTGRLLRDAELSEIGAGTSEIRRMVIGRELFEKIA